MNDRRPPCDPEAEAALLGAMLMEPTVIDEVLPIVSAPEAFAGTSDYRHLFATIVDVHQAGDVVEFFAMQRRLQGRQQKPEHGPESWEQLALEVSEACIDPCNAVAYARHIAADYKRRQLIGIALGLSAHGFDPLSDPDRVAHSTATALDGVAQGAQPAAVVRIDDMIRDWQETSANGAETVKTGIGSFDFHYSGLEYGALTVLAARPSVGKTSLALGWLVHAAVAGNIPSMFVSVEMNHLALAQRVASLLSGLSAYELARQFNPERCKAAIDEVRGKLEDAPLYIVDNKTNVRDIAAIAQVYHRKHGVKIVAVDYLQLCEPAERCENQNLRVASMSKAFKRLATDTGCAVLVVSQLSRQAAIREPMLSDLRDSGAIEQDADVVLFLHTKETDTAKPLWEVTCNVAKNRNGPCGRLTFGFQRPQMRFVELDKRAEG